MSYKKIVDQIKQLNWQKLTVQELQQLMFISYASAIEFAQALRIARDLYPEDDQLRRMSEGELDTNNLHYEDYSQSGDHSDFLKHFISKNSIRPNNRVRSAINAYHETCAAFDNTTRAMSIFSRERELPDIFERILEANDWSAPGLPAFRYYLRTHIALDGGDGGHQDLTKEFSVDDSVKPFYAARLMMYQSIPALFTKTA